MASKKQPVNRQALDSSSHESAVIDNHDHIKTIIAETIKELHANDAVQIQKPKTLQGWLYIIGAICGLCGLLWTGIVKLDAMASHAKKPHHDGVEVLVKRFEEAQAKHEEDRNLHRTEAELQLKIMKETEPIKEDLHLIKEDVREIQRSVDILVEDNRRRNHQ